MEESLSDILVKNKKKLTAKIKAKKASLLSLNAKKDAIKLEIDSLVITRAELVAIIDAL